jgi:hypothetical protein
MISMARWVFSLFDEQTQELHRRGREEADVAEKTIFVFDSFLLFSSALLCVSASSAVKALCSRVFE